MSSRHSAGDALKAPFTESERSCLAGFVAHLQKMRAHIAKFDDPPTDAAKAFKQLVLGEGARIFPPDEPRPEDGR
jgi:hypothetical protein